MRYSSRELTISPPSCNFESMIFLFLFGGICDRSLQGRAVDESAQSTHKSFALNNLREDWARHASEMERGDSGLTWKLHHKTIIFRDKKMVSTPPFEGILVYIYRDIYI